MPRLGVSRPRKRLFKKCMLADGVGNDVLANNRVVPDEETGGFGTELEGNTAGDVIEDVAEEVGRSAENGL